MGIIKDLLRRNQFLRMQCGVFASESQRAKKDVELMLNRWTSEKSRIIEQTTEAQMRMYNEFNEQNSELETLKQSYMKLQDQMAKVKKENIELHNRKQRAQI